MFWTSEKQYLPFPYEKEAELEEAILEVEKSLFGPQRIYLDAKKKIGSNRRKRNIPDGYLIDLSDSNDPKLYVVENELEIHDPIRHIAVQLLEFSISFDSDQLLVKAIIKEALQKNKSKFQFCTTYAHENGFENLDYLLEKMILGAQKFNGLVIIDQCPEDLETVLVNKFRFPVEILTLERFRSIDNHISYSFTPFLSDVIDTSTTEKTVQHISDIDTIVVPAREDGFNNVFLKEDRWYAVRIHSSMISRLRYLATYEVSPKSAITYIAPIRSIEPWENTGKYVVNFSDHPKKISEVKLVKKGKVKAPQGPRYASYNKIVSAKTLDDVF